MNFLELAATLFGVCNLFLCIRANVWNWFFGILMVSFYAVIFFHAKLYADMLFQLIALLLQFYGLLRWQKNNNHQANFDATWMHSITWCGVIMVTSVLFLSSAYLLQRLTDSSTVFLDALVMSISLAALWMQSNKFIEHWLVWIVCNCLSIQLYVIKSLYFTAGLYVLFTILCLFGFKEWRGLLKNKICFA